MNPKSKAVGVDTSLTNTGVYWGEGCWEEIKGKKLRGTERLQMFYDEFTRIFRHINPDIAVIEGYAFGARSRHHRLGELGGVVRVALRAAGCVSIYEVPPTSLKLYATGSGRAGKDEMLASAEEAEGFLPPSHDVADAIWLWRAGVDPEFDLTKWLY